MQKSSFFYTFDCENLHWTGKEREGKRKTEQRSEEREEKENRVIEARRK